MEDKHVVILENNVFKLKKSAIVPHVGWANGLLSPYIVVDNLHIMS